MKLLLGVVVIAVVALASVSIHVDSSVATFRSRVWTMDGDTVCALPQGNGYDRKKEMCLTGERTAQDLADDKSY